MVFSHFPALLLLPCLVYSASIPFTRPIDVESTVANLTSSAYASGLSLLNERETSLQTRADESHCSIHNIAIRREYGSFSSKEKLQYIDAVKCLQKLPPRTPANVSSGARSRFDDFTVVHIQQTLDIHFSGIFLPWHRWFVHSYEKALREECGYQGYQPVSASFRRPTISLRR